MKKKHIIAVVAALLLTVPLSAVFTEKNLSKTLHVLRFELKQEYDKMFSSERLISDQNSQQHDQMVKIMKSCNELALMLYSQNQDFTFDMTYALRSVTKQYEDFNKSKLPYDDIVGRLDGEIQRYSRLLESLRRLPPALPGVSSIPDSLGSTDDSLNVGSQGAAADGSAPAADGAQAAESDSTASEDLMSGDEGSAEDTRPFVLDEIGQHDRDSCIQYATSLLMMYSFTKDYIVEDSIHYNDASLRLKESYDYAQDRYKALQKTIFVQGQQNYITLLSSFKTYWSKAKMDAQNKYAFNINNASQELKDSEWRGVNVMSFVWSQILLIAFSALVSIFGVKLLRRKIKWMSEKNFKLISPGVICLLSVLMFSLLTLIASWVVSYGFFKVASGQVLVYAWLRAAILMSLLIHLKPEQVSKGLWLYMPIAILALLVIACRVVFVPNSLINIFLFPLLLLAFVWQVFACRKHMSEVALSDRIVCWCTLFVLMAALVFSFMGYVFVGLLILIWWFFQLSCIETLIAIGHILNYYKQMKVDPRLEERRSQDVYQGYKEKKETTFSVTWLQDLVNMVIMPLLAVFSIPFCLYLTFNVFDFHELCNVILLSPFVSLHNSAGGVILHLSAMKILIGVGLFMVFRYINYAAHALYMQIKYAAFMRKYNKTYVKKDDVNLSLGNSIISVVIWFTYIIIIVMMFKIPTGSLTIIAGGLSAGVGLAMKDVLNNFIYGIQLMSGRLRVGDWMECDGIRGKVSSISYQSTQVETTDGAVMSFLNTSLFAKNFKNLTINNSYEFTKIVVGVSYGTDVNLVREKLLEAIKVLQKKDSYGRQIVDPSHGVSVTFEEFGDSSVNIAVKQFVLVPERATYIDSAKEIIYNTLSANKIEIPFPQQEIRIRTTE